MALFPELPGWAGTRKVKPVWILLKQETVSGSGIRWAICKSALSSRQITTPAPHHSVFLQAGCPSCRPTNSVKALKANIYYIRTQNKNVCIIFLLILPLLKISKQFVIFKHKTRSIIYQLFRCILFVVIFVFFVWMRLEVMIFYLSYLLLFLFHLFCCYKIYGIDV